MGCKTHGYVASARDSVNGKMSAIAQNPRPGGGRAFPGDDGEPDRGVSRRGSPTHVMLREQPFGGEDACGFDSCDDSVGDSETFRARYCWPSSRTDTAPLTRKNAVFKEQS